LPLDFVPYKFGSLGILERERIVVQRVIVKFSSV